MTRLSLAIVETPLQLLCAYEAVGENRNGITVLRLTGVGRNDSQTLELAKKLKMDCIVVSAPVGHTLSILRGLWTLRHLMLHHYEAVYLGSYFSRFIQLMARFLRGPKFLLDDGVATLLAQEKMMATRRPMSIYTFLPVEALAGQTCVKHSFEKLRARFQIDSKGQSGTYFIGQPLVEKALVSEREYIFLLRKIVKESGHVNYISHRAESEVMLAKIGSIPGITVVEIEVPVELEFLSNPLLPEKIYSCISTALFSLSMILPSTKVEATPISSLANSTKAPHISAILRAMKSSDRIIFTEENQ